MHYVMSAAKGIEPLARRHRAQRLAADHRVLGLMLSVVGISCVRTYIYENFVFCNRVIYVHPAF